MRSLFLKIFLWFWLAMALVWASFIIPTERTQNEDAVARWRAFTRQRFLVYGEAALFTSYRSGHEAMLALMETVEADEGGYPLVLDDEMKDIAGREPSDLEIDAARGALADPDRTTRVRLVDGSIVAYSFVGPYGGTYVVVGQLPPRLDFRTTDWLAWAARWGSMLLISGLVCYGLARYLTAPVTKLSHATRRFADGDLTVRVGPRLGSRGDEIADLGRDFDVMAGRIEALVNTQKQLLSDISHELRSPLSRLYVALGLARKRRGPELDAALDRMESETERINDLIGQLLSLARLESGAAPMTREEVDLGELVRDVAADADYEAKSQNRRVEVTDLEPCSTEGIDELLRRAIENVVRNAVRHTADGTTATIALRSVRDNGARHALITVKDRGPGVAEDALRDMFQPFYRLDDARDRASGGTGLGLSISERAVRVHGGTITARNGEDGGLVIDIRLPLETHPAAEPGAG